LSEQAVLTEFIEEGHFGRQLRRMRVLYEERGTILYEAVSSFYLAQRKRHGLILGFAAFDARQIRDGAQKLAKALEGKLRVEDKEAC
jgi:GntR family transcriptional regulator/MocR family aminotransferase